MVLVLTVIVLQSISFANYALTAQTTNIIQGSAPYLTFDGGRTRVTNTEALLGISLSDGRRFTPTTTNSRYNPIELPVVGQSFNDIGMLVPTDTNSIALSSLIGPPNNYWGDDDGDGQGVNGITATGSLNLSIVDYNNNPVARNEVLTMCKALYKLTLSNDEGTLKTRYGVPNESRFNASNATYYIMPKTAPVVCYAAPNSIYGEGLSAAVWKKVDGFLPQSVTPSSYGLNFPTTGANNLQFRLMIKGINQALSWAPVSHGGITATMTDSRSTSVRVTLTGPAVIGYNPGGIARPSLPQVFELVGRDSSGNAVVKYGFVLKQWFVQSASYTNSGYYSNTSSWCNNIGYRLPKVKDLTNASCPEGGGCLGSVGATPSSPDNSARHHIGGGLFSEWGNLCSTYYNPIGSFPCGTGYWTQDRVGSSQEYFIVESEYGRVSPLSPSYDRWYYNSANGVCVYP
ncbi:hypothetical protein [Gilliamella sp. W8128]|uniref:hypothetical protein n=1 Tax=Gilliamella sp. W8128 TaxID=2751010 RepID=UPI0018DBB38D|nr:hypothetical protein [Gilliamella sp. W8128]MBI0155476.1 hypothetical protein [Gilliamella sp. W8128]